VFKKYSANIIARSRKLQIIRVSVQTERCGITWWSILWLWSMNRSVE